MNANKAGHSLGQETQGSRARRNWTWHQDHNFFLGKIKWTEGSTRVTAKINAMDCPFLQSSKQKNCTTEWHHNMQYSISSIMPGDAPISWILSFRNHGSACLLKVIRDFKKGKSWDADKSRAEHFYHSFGIWFNRAHLRRMDGGTPTRKLRVMTEYLHRKRQMVISSYCVNPS